MDTIIYFYHSQSAEEFITEKWQEDGYCLIRAGVPACVWKGLREMNRGAEREQKGAVRKRERRGGKWFWPNRANRRSRRFRGEEPGGHGELSQRLGDWQTALCMLADNPDRRYCVYEDFLRRRLDTEEGRTLWSARWQIPEFEDYRDSGWVELLMRRAVSDHYVIVGYADCLPELLYRRSRQMRSVRWILREGQYTDEMERFVGDFYEESGLALEIRLIGAEESWTRMRPFSAVPANILDCSGEERLSACDVAAGSVWLDMDAMDGKRRRIEARNPQITYFSMKKEWEQWKKNRPAGSGPDYGSA